MSLKKKLVIILGPTASGKTAIGIELAEKFNGEIINADSRQVYRFLDIGTAKPNIEEREKIPHHLIDVVNPDEEFSAGTFRELSKITIEKIVKNNKNPFVVGGTGLYIKVLTGGIIKCPNRNKEIIDKLNDELKNFGNRFLYEKLKLIDPKIASKIHINDTYRIIRALEIIETTGKPVSLLYENHQFKEEDYETLKIGLALERQILYSIINKRVDEMIKKGLVEEVKRLFKMGYSLSLKSMQSLGYLEIGNYLLGNLSFEEAIYILKRETRRFAKRQLTWFRADKRIKWFNPLTEKEKIFNEVADFLKKSI